MNKIVSIFGGLGTKQSHYKHAIEVYKSNGYTTNFYGNKHIDLFIPKRYAKNVKYAYANDTTGTIIHINSGGFWTGLDYLGKTTNNKLFICEAGPMEAKTTFLIYVLENIYNVKCPDFIVRNINMICANTGMSWCDKEHEWHMKYKNDLEHLRNFVCLTSKNDILIDNKYIDSIITKINIDTNKSAKRYEFDSGTHWNISKNETQKYQDILQQELDQIAKH